MRWYFIYIVSLLLLIGSCKTDPPTTGGNNPVFYVHAKVNNENISLVAGDNGYYMEPNFQTDSLNIRSFEGHLGKLNCVGDIDCPSSILFSFREVQKQQGNHQGVEQTIYPRTVLPRGPADYYFESYKATFFSQSVPSNLMHYWDFGDGEYSSDVNPVHYYTNPDDSIITPILTVSNGTGCSNFVKYPIHFKSPCDVDFGVKYNGAALQLSPTPTIGRTELWSYNYGTYVPQSSLPQLPQDSIFPVCLESSGASPNCISYKCKNVVIDTAKVACVANFDVVKQTILIKDVQDYGEVSVFYQNEQGVTYSSDLFEQPDDSFFSIMEVTDYIASQKGYETKRLLCQYQLRLYGSNEEDFVTISSDSSAIAIAFP